MPFPVSQPRQRNVEVVAFSGRGPARRSTSSVGRKTAATADEKTMGDMLSIKTEIGNFISSSLVGKEKNRFDKGRLQVLGASAPKPQKIPFKMAVGIKRAQEERQKKAEDLARFAGNKVPSKQARHKKTVAVKGRGRWKESIKPLESSAVGKFRGSALTVSQKDIAKLSGKRRK